MFKKSIRNVPYQIKTKFQVIKQYGTGGSSAGILLVKGKNKESIQILKYATWQGIGSSGIPWLKAQTERFTELKNILPKKVKNWIPDVYDIYSKKGLFYYTMQYYNNGVPLSVYYFNNPSKNINFFINDINKIIDFLSEYFYSKGKLNVPINYIYKVHIEKIFYRLSFLQKTDSLIFKKYLNNIQLPIKIGSHYNLKSFFSTLIKSKKIIINDQEYLNAPFLLNKYFFNNNLKRLTPNFLPKYNHGDSTLRNYLKLPNRMVLIDIRGTDLPKNAPSRVCIPYELGKILRSFLLEVVRNNYFDIKISILPNEKINFNFTYHTQDKKVDNFLKIRSILPSLLEKNNGLKEILKNEHDWIMKSYFAEACHFLADASNRLESDETGYQTIAYYLIGCQLLANFNKSYF